jgi:hypothetical protein
MATESLLAALKENYGLADQVVDDVNTVRGLLSFCKKWPRGGPVSAAELNNPCLLMAAQLREAAGKVERDLKENPEMAQEMRAPVQRTMEAYTSIAEVLEELPELARDQKESEFQENLELWEEERQAVLDAQQQIESFLSGSIAICPCCGSSGEPGECGPCQLLRLYPDPQAQRNASAQSHVQGLYHQVFQAYTRVLSGQRPLSDLWEALYLLEQHLDLLLQTRLQTSEQLDSGVLSGQPLEEAQLTEAVLGEAEPHIEQAIRGIEQMRVAEETLRVHDLSRGWEDIYHAAQAIEAATSRIRRELLAEEESVGTASPPASASGGGDQIALSGEG